MKIFFTTKVLVRCYHIGEIIFKAIATSTRAFDSMPSAWMIGLPMVAGSFSIIAVATTWTIED